MQIILRFPHGKGILINFGLIPTAFGKDLQVSSWKFMILRIGKRKEVTKGPKNILANKHKSIQIYK